MVYKFHAQSFGGSRLIPGRANQPRGCSSCAQECPKAMVLLAPRTLKYLTAAPANAGTTGQPHWWVTFAVPKYTLPQMSPRVIRSFSSTLTKPRREIHLLQAAGTRLSHTRCALCEGNQKQVMFEPAVPTQLVQAITRQLCQYRETQKCPFAPVCAGMCLQRGLSTAWHTEASLQIRDEGLFSSFPTAN